MKKSIITFLLVALVGQHVAWSQQYVANHFSSNQFNAHAVMWDMAEDAHGYLWFANNDGVVRYDGNNWVTFSTPNQVRSIVVTKRSEIFVACLEDFGVLKFTGDGATQYTSFKSQLDASILTKGGDEKVWMLGDDVYFSSGSVIFSVKENKGAYTISIVDKERNIGCGVLQQKVFVNHTKQGLGWIKGGRYTPIENGYELAGKQVVQALSIGGKDIVFTNYDGAYLLNNNKLSKLQQSDLSTFAMNGIADVVLLDNEKFAVATYHHGVKIFNYSFQQLLGIELPSSETYQLAVDHQQNLWVSHHKGLTHVLTGLPVTTHRYSAVSGSINEIYPFKAFVFASTTNGLFTTTTSNPTQLSLVAGMNAECWDVEEHQNTLYAASTNGLYAVVGTNAKLLIPNEVFLQLQVGNRSGKLYAFGINSTVTIDDKGIITPLKEVKVAANSVHENADGGLWVGTHSNGLIHISASSKISLPDEITTGEVRIRTLDGKLFVQSKNGVFALDGNSFIKDEVLTSLWSGIRNHDVVMDKNGCLFTDKEWIKVANGKRIPMNIAYMLNGKPTAYDKSSTKEWFASEDKIYWVQPTQINIHATQSNISRLEYGSLGVAFNGIFVSKNNEVTVAQDIIPEINHTEQSIRFWFGINSFINPEKNAYRYKIEGLNEQWSEWTNESKLTLNGLSGGSYKLILEARDALGNEAKISSYAFYIKPPWYQSGIAFMVYILGCMLLMYVVVLVYNKRLVSKNNELEQRVQERTVELQKEKQKSDALLLNILPEGVAEELKNKGFAEAKQYNNVTVLFTDMVNFTGISEQMSPKELVAEIHQNFTVFDGIMEKHGLEKIKTIGDAYLAVSGLPVEHPDHAIRVTRAALDIQHYMAQNGGKFQIRIGIHSGPLVAGIVGVKKYAFDIWGDTVNTAARMEQNSDAGKINISAATHGLIKDIFTFEYRGKIKAKNKGEVDMWFVVS